MQLGVCMYVLSPDSAVYTPEDGDNWTLAKLNVQITDIGYAQIGEHLAKVKTNPAYWRTKHILIIQTRVVLLFILNQT